MLCIYDSDCGGDGDGDGDGDCDDHASNGILIIYNDGADCDVDIGDDDADCDS